MLLEPALPLTSLAAVLGLVVGSFVNVVAHRVPAGLSVVRPRSACPGCRTPIAAYDNLPVVSWLLLRGRCRSCREPISVRYPLVEAATGALFAGLAWWLLDREPAVLPLFLYLGAIGVALFLIDLDVRRLPDRIVLPSYVVVAGLLVLASAWSGEWPWLRSLASLTVWLLVFAVPWYATSGRGMGFGDVKLAPILGLALGWLGWGESLVGLLAGFALGTVYGVAAMAAGRASRRTAVPYGVFMLPGALLGLLLGQPVWEWYLRTTGLA